ncbi:aspartate aminotransferase family protein [Rhodobaculum claviforme]|uniref:Aspartate aminotransferase family protein n=1 Tax=Rhodobaculum claviforme TaxID=1549854 RepID=A0A934TMR5_9RHOB|nr:aspartate aminotransferase family protein [Rhodobaculum claviforme]MBK5928032.1 aspartate aminotransferase family protein [Rhodobaculum claviforme]
MDTLPNSPEARDIEYHMHPYTNARRHQEVGPMVLDRGEGVHVFDSAGNRYIEAMAGLWSVAVGFSEERLVEAAVQQMRKLPYSHSFAHRSHGPAIDLAEKLIQMAPVPMSKVFFTNSGSEANDTVMKLLWYRSNAMGQPQRKKIISRLRGYHGITIASGSLTGLPYNHKSFDLPLPGVLHVGCPHFWREGQEGESEEAFATRLAAELEETIQREGPDTIAAFIGEPVMGAGGVVVPPKGYWEKIQAVLKRHDIPLIADEVICGFGRTGRMFGSELYGIEPDIMVMSKQMTSSYLPMAAVMMNARIFEPIADETHRIGTFGHGFTASGHPVAAAVSMENIRIIEERGLVEQAARVGAHMQARLRALSDMTPVGEVRGVGMIAAVELVGDPVTKAPHGKPGTLGAALQAAMQDEGILVRALGDTVAVCPPLITTETQADEIVDAFHRAIPRVAAHMAQG